MLKFKLETGEALDIIFYQQNYRQLNEQNKASCFSTFEVLSDKNYSNFSNVKNFFVEKNILIGETVLPSYSITDENDVMIATCYDNTFSSISMSVGVEEKNVIRVEFLRIPQN